MWGILMKKQDRKSIRSATQFCSFLPSLPAVLLCCYAAVLSFLVLCCSAIVKQ